MTGYQAIAIGSLCLVVIAGLWDAVRIWRKRRYSTLALLIDAVGPIVALGAYMAVTGLSLKLAATLALVVAGGILGILAAEIASLARTRDGAIVLTRAAWLPLPAAICVGAVQACAAAGSLAGVILALAALEAAAGFGVGAVLGLSFRRLTLGPAGAEGPEQTAQA
jgi:hypothetical protein